MRCCHVCMVVPIKFMHQQHYTYYNQPNHSTKPTTPTTPTHQHTTYTPIQHNTHTITHNIPIIPSCIHTSFTHHLPTLYPYFHSFVHVHSFSFLPSFFLNSIIPTLQYLSYTIPPLHHLLPCMSDCFVAYREGGSLGFGLLVV